MDNEQKIENGKILYISGYGRSENETIVYALTMPVSVTTIIDDDGSAWVEFREKTEQDNWQVVCQTGVIPDVAPPARWNELKHEKDVENAISKTVAGWISIFMRDGVFCTDAQKLTFLSSFDLRDVAKRLQKDLEELYRKYQDEYKM